MPAPAVIPAPIVYFKIVAVKTFVVVPRGAYLGSMVFHCYAWSCLGWSVAVSTSAWGTVACHCPLVGCGLKKGRPWF